MLKNFLFEQKQRRIRVTEGIAHLEALPVQEFVNALTNIDKFVASEKLDGYNLWFGFDSTGFFTSRGAKGGAVYRSESEYPDTPASNGFRSVHAALESIATILHRFVQDGETVEVEVLFGRQPNAIVYGDNMIAFLRFTQSDDLENSGAKLDQLASALSGKVVKTITPHMVTTDGRTLDKTSVSHDWKFVSTTKLDSAIVSNVDLSDDIAKVTTFLKTANTALPSMTNGQVLTVNLTTIPKGEREVVKRERENVTDTFLHDFKLPIKDKLIDKLLRPTKSPLQTAAVSDGEDIGIEGIVFLDPATNQQFKLVDKDLFTTVNKFNFAVRSAIKSTSAAENPFLQSLGLSSGGSIFDQMIGKVGQIFGISNDLKYYNIKRALSKFGDSPQTIVDTLAKNTDDFDTALNGVQAAINTAQTDLDKMLKQFQQNWKRYSVKLPGGKRIKYNAEIYNRTMTSFAETHEELASMLKRVNSATSVEHLISIVFSRQLKTESDGE